MRRNAASLLWLLTVTHDPLCSVPFLGLCGKRKLLCGLLVTMRCSQATKGTLIQAGNTRPVVLRWAFALMWGKKPISCICEKPDVPTEGKRGALIIKAEAVAPLAQVRVCWQSRFVLGVQLRAVYWWLAGGSALLQHHILPDLMPGSVHKRSKSCWNTGNNLKGKRISCLSMSVCLGQRVTYGILAERMIYATKHLAFITIFYLTLNRSTHLSLVLCFFQYLWDWSGNGKSEDYVHLIWMSFNGSISILKDILE